MSVKASVTITISKYRDCNSVTRYYKLQTSTSAAPAIPTTLNPSGWSTAEPTYTSGSTNTLYYTDCYIFSDGTFQYTDDGNGKAVKSSSYEAAKEAYNKAQAAQDSIDNVQIGGRNLLLDSAFPIGTTKWYRSNDIVNTIDTTVKYLGNNSIRLENMNTNRLDVPGKYYSEYILGKPLILTFYIMCPDVSKITSNINAWIGYKNSSYSPVTATQLNIHASDLTNNVWKKITIKSNTTNENAKYCTMMIQPNNPDAILYISSPKLEYGTKSTDWTPAPEDINQAVPEVVVGTQTATTASWTGNASFKDLVDGQQIVYWLPRTSNNNATLNLTLSDGTTTGAKNVYYSGTTRVGTQYPAGNAIRLIYRKNVSINGSTTLYTGWWADANYDSNNTNLLRFQQKIKAATNITAGQLIAGTVSGFKPIAQNVSFDLDKPILVSNSTISADATSDNAFLVRPDVNITKNVSNWTGTQYENCYLVGTISGNTFTPKSPVFTTTKPNSESDLYYISLGYMYSTTNMILYPEHPIFKYVNGQFKNISQIAFEAKDDIDNLDIGGRNWIINSCALYENKNYWGSTENLEYITPNQNGGIFNRPYLNFSKEISEGVEETIYNTSLMNKLTDIDSQMSLSGFIRNNSDSAITVSIRVRSISDQTIVKFSSQIQLQANSDWVYFNKIDSIENITDNLLLEYIFNDNADIDVDISSFKLETGNKATDWTPAPEDVDNEVEKRATIDELNATKVDLQRQINNAQLMIDSLNAMIQTLVVGENGESLMEQTDTGWVFKLKPTLDAIAQVQNDVNNTIDGVQNSGGNNLILNSVMYACNINGEPNNWILSNTGTIEISSSVESLSNGAVSGNVFVLNNKTVKQLVRVTPGKSYTFTTKIKKDTTGTCYAKLYNTIDEHIISLANGQSAFYEEKELQNLIPSEDYYYVEFYGSSNSNATFTDNMLSLGEFKTRWQQASGEVMNAQVNIDKNGILIKSSLYDGDYTVMSPLEFAGYSKVNGVQTKIFSLNKDTTEVEKLNAKKSIAMDPIKVLPITTGTLQGWAFVPK